MNNQLKTYLVLGISIMLIGCATPQARMPTVATGSAAEEAKKQQALVVEDYMSNYRRLQMWLLKLWWMVQGCVVTKLAAFMALIFGIKIVLVQR